MKQASKNTYLKTIGLLELAKGHYEEIRDIERTLAALLEVKEESTDYYGHVSDAVWGERYSAKELFDRMEIELNEDKLFKDKND